MRAALLGQEVAFRGGELLEVLHLYVAFLEAELEHPRRVDAGLAGEVQQLHLSCDLRFSAVLVEHRRSLRVADVPLFHGDLRARQLFQEDELVTGRLPTPWTARGCAPG